MAVGDVIINRFTPGTINTWRPATGTIIMVVAVYGDYDRTSFYLYNGPDGTQSSANYVSDNLAELYDGRTNFKRLIGNTISIAITPNSTKRIYAAGFVVQE